MIQRTQITYIGFNKVMSNYSKAKQWRNIFLSGRYSRSQLTEEQCRQEAERDYESAKTDLARQIASGVEEKNQRSNRMGIYLSGLMLLTYGRLDTVSDILNNCDGWPYELAMFLKCLSSLIPFPPRLLSLPGREDLIAWLDQNKDNLEWNEERGCFLLR